MSVVVLDSWAVLAYLQDEAPAGQAVATLLDDSVPVMSWINLGEVHYVLRRRHGEAAALEAIRDLQDVLDVRLPDERLVLEAARIKADHPLAHADAFAAATAIATGATLWTGDEELLIEKSPWIWRDLRTN